MRFSLLSFVRKSLDCLCQSAKQRLGQWTKLDNHAPVLNAALHPTRTRRELMLENMVPQMIPYRLMPTIRCQRRISTSRTSAHMALPALLNIKTSCPGAVDGFIHQSLHLIRT
jgi:hypothetical protein